MIETLIVDDEAPARRRIRDLLASEQDIHIAAECSDGIQALAKINDCHPALMFLDIRMPTLSGLDLVSKLDTVPRPYIIFTTAYTSHALIAFEFDAVDYLVKPIERDRFETALQKMRRRISSELYRAEGSSVQQLVEQVSQLRTMLRAQHSGDDRLAVRTGSGIRVLEITGISHITGDGDYLDVHFVNDSPLKIRERMTALETKLLPHNFLRIQRSIIINSKQIASIHPDGRGDFKIMLQDGKSFVSGRAFRIAITNLISAWGNTGSVA